MAQVMLAGGSWQFSDSLEAITDLYDISKLPTNKRGVYAWPPPPPAPKGTCRMTSKSMPFLTPPDWKLLAENYFTQNIAIVAMQLMRGGVRLANILNSVE